MAVLAAAALLDELMGRNRNVAPNEKAKELNWEDAEYCKYYLVKFCPHDLFVNTRADLGACTKIHDEEVRQLYLATVTSSSPAAAAPSRRKLHYQEEFIRFCTSMVNEVDRKILKGKQRLALSMSGPAGLVGKLAAGTSKLHFPSTDSEDGGELSGSSELSTLALLQERINGLVEEAEAAGNEGNVEQAQGLMKLCDQLKEERDALLVSSAAPSLEMAAAQQEKQMEVCQVCGAFLIVGDAQQRIDDHLMGKQHVGYARLKAAIKEVQAEVDDVRQRNGGGGGAAPRCEKRDNKLPQRDGGRPKEHERPERDRHFHRHRSRDQRRHHYKERNERNNDRDRSNRR